MFFGAPSYANQPTITPSNLMLMPGKGDLEELMGEIKEGMLIKGSLIGALHSNALTGDFSVTSNNAFKIESGEIAYPLKPCTLAGNLYETLNSVITWEATLDALEASSVRRLWLKMLFLTKLYLPAINNVQSFVTRAREKEKIPLKAALRETISITTDLENIWRVSSLFLFLFMALLALSQYMTLLR